MKISVFGSIMCSAIISALVLTSPAVAKTVKECQSEWRANKAANQAKGVTEKAYVAQCSAGASAEKPKAAPAAASKTKEKKEKTSTKAAVPAAGEKKTIKECQTEWRANKAANQAKDITEKAYVEQCRAGGGMMKPAAAPPASAPTQTKMAPPTAAPAKPAARSEPAPATGAPTGANQFVTESAAQAHCRSGLVVWANLDSKIYHFAGHADYGHTKKGAYMCEKDAMGQGIRAAKNEKHP